MPLSQKGHETARPARICGINRKLLPAPIKIRGARVAVLIWSIALFGTLSVLTFRAQLERLFGG
jgi:hypothetical protein